VTVPLVKEGRLVAVLSIHAAAARAWTPNEVAMVEETAERTWAAVERARAEAALRESEEKYRSLFESMDEGFFLAEVILAEDGRPVDILFLEANPAATRMVGQDFSGRRLSAIDPRFEPYWAGIWGQVARTGRGARLERFAAPLGAWYDFYTFPVGERGNRRVATVFQDVSARKEIEEELRASRAQLLHRAHHDHLTGLPNRALFEDRLRLAVASAARRERILAVLFVDLDGFKFVNDSLGHAAGDHVLEAVAARLRASLREEDTLARLHGDEFVVLLPEINHPYDAEYLARTLNAAVSQPVDVGDKPVVLSASIGISVYPRDGADAEALLRAADVAMYHVKLQGKNGGRFFEGSMRAPAEERVALGEHFDGALERGELAVLYQPQWDSRTGRIAAFEALLRWTSPLLGELSPARFVPIAEERGAFGPVASWTLDECGAAAVGLSPASGLPCRIALNVTPARLARASFVSRVEATARWHGIEPRQIELELNGVPQAHEAVGLGAALERLKDVGVRVTLDRFRADAGMVALLLDLGLDGVKIEPPVVDRAARDPRLRRGLEAMIALVHDLGLDVTAVGIETRAQHDLMLALGCDRLQGYYVGQPMTWSEALALVQGQQVATLFS
jgi:diguanylate cyclase